MGGHSHHIKKGNNMELAQNVKENIERRSHLIIVDHIEQFKIREADSGLWCLVIYIRDRVVWTEELTLRAAVAAQVKLYDAILNRDALVCFHSLEDAWLNVSITAAKDIDDLVKKWSK